MLILPTGSFASTPNWVFSNVPPYGVINWNCPLNAWRSVTSKWNQPRNVNGTNPHQGVDLDASMGTSVCAVWNGWLTNTGTYSVRLQLDINNNNVQDDSDSVYCNYFHLSGKKPNGYYRKGAQVGASGDEGGKYEPHLHFGGIDANSKWYRNEVNYRWTSYWNYGRDVDSFSNVQWNWPSCNITVYFKDESGTYKAQEVVIWHREHGTSTWTFGGSMVYEDNYTYSYDFSSRYSGGTTIDWLVRMRRPNLPSGTYPYCWAPAKYDCPDPNPNNASYSYVYYKNTL